MNKAPTCPDCGSSSPVYTPDRWTERQVRDVKTGEQRTVRTYEKPHCIACSMHREQEQHRQMRERAGPQYELAAGRSRVISEAYRAVGSPPEVIREWFPVTGPDGRTTWEGSDGEPVHEERVLLAAPWRKRREIVEAAPEQAEAWAAWQRQKALLRAGLDGDRPVPE